jgi:hypothetical protein
VTTTSRNRHGFGWHKPSIGLFAFAVALAIGITDAVAAGGTATPPLPGRGQISPLSTPAPELPAPVFSAAPQDIKGFSVVGFVQSATVSGSNCPGLPQAQWGGTVVVNDLVITVPCNSVVQMPAATFAWSDLFNPSQIQTTLVTPASLTLTPGPRPPAGGFSYPSTEITIAGNNVGGRLIAGLVFASQQSLNTSSGYIVGFDFAKGVILVGSQPGGEAKVRLQLNDSRGRFSSGQTTDSRFNVDDENPTIRAATGYPMCVPRTDPGVADDPLCPQRNRPLASAGCRNFAAVGLLLPSRIDLTPPAAGQTYCTSFVMGDPATAGPAMPDSTQQAPFEPGDFITYSGTLLKGDGKGPGGSDTISAHTITGNVGIFTEPGTLPVYLAIGEFGVGPEFSLTFFGVPQEAQERLFLDAVVTDIMTIVDVYMIDLDPVTGQETQRWVTPYSMTGGVGQIGLDGTYIDGGITTQFAGPVPGRVRIRAGKSTPGILRSPTRYMRVVARSTCDPATINGQAPIVSLGPRVEVACLDRAPAANGLRTGQYMAPVTSFIFPENVTPGDPLVPYNFWSLGFLINGEGPGTGPLIPTPW